MSNHLHQPPLDLSTFLFFVPDAAGIGLSARSLSNPKFGVPKPVTGSQPLTAVKPWVLHPGLFPPTISLRPLYPFEYNQGFRNPRGGRFAARRASLMREITEAKVCLYETELMTLFVEINEARTYG